MSAGSADWLYPVSVMELRPIGGVRLRRAVLGILLAAHRPLTVAEVVTDLHSAGFTTWSLGPRPPHVIIADLLAHQARAGRVRRTARATYAPNRGNIPSTTQWRCRHWRD